MSEGTAECVIAGVPGFSPLKSADGSATRLHMIFDTAFPCRTQMRIASSDCIVAHPSRRAGMVLN
jgi:hypothetical protein